MSLIVVDASVAVKWFVPEEGSDQADAIASSGRDLLAPSLIVTEVANTFWKKVRRGLMSPDAAVSELAILPRYFSEMPDAADFAIEATQLAIRFDHPVYDMIYCVAARRRDAVMVTADTRLVARLARTDLARHVVPLAEWTAP